MAGPLKWRWPQDEDLTSSNRRSCLVLPDIACPWIGFMDPSDIFGILVSFLPAYALMEPTSAFPVLPAFAQKSRNARLQSASLPGCLLPQRQ